MQGALIGVLMRTAGASRCCSSSSESAHDSSRSVACHICRGHAMTERRMVKLGKFSREIGIKEPDMLSSCSASTKHFAEHESSCCTVAK